MPLGQKPPKTAPGHRPPRLKPPNKGSLGLGLILGLGLGVSARVTVRGAFVLDP